MGQNYLKALGNHRPAIFLFLIFLIKNDNQVSFFGIQCPDIKTKYSPLDLEAPKFNAWPGKKVLGLNFNIFTFGKFFLTKPIVPSLLLLSTNKTSKFENFCEKIPYRHFKTHFFFHF